MSSEFRESLIAEGVLVPGSRPLLTPFLNVDGVPVLRIDEAGLGAARLEHEQWLRGGCREGVFVWNVPADVLASISPRGRAA